MIYKEEKSQNEYEILKELNNRLQNFNKDKLKEKDKEH